MSDLSPSHQVVGGLDQLSGPAALGSLFALDATEAGWRNRVSLRNIGGQILGGQIAALGLKAAWMDAGANLPNAIHVLFLSSPAATQPSTITVEPIRDGRRLTHRLARLTQDGRVRAQVEVTLASPALALDAPDFEYDAPLPDVPGPHELPTRQDLLAEYEGPHTTLAARLLVGHPFLEIRPVPRDPEPGARARFWVRATDARTLDPIDQLCLLTLITDYWYTLPAHHLPGAREALGEEFSTTSLDHALWFQTIPDCSAWMLFEADCPAIRGGIALLRAQIWNQEGKMLAFCSQQALLIPNP